MSVKDCEFQSDFSILITGAGGFVGQWLRNALLARLPEDARIICATRSIADGSNQSTDARERWISLDVTDRQAVGDALKISAPNVVVHLAAISNVQEAARATQKAFDVNLLGTMNIASAINMHCAAARFINVGSSEVYGGSFAGTSSPIAEDAVLDPSNIYATSKAAADLLIGQMVKGGLNTIRFRPFNHTGPGQSEKFVVPGFAAQIARIEKGLQPPTISVGNLEAKRDFTDVRDIVAAYVLACGTAGNAIASGQIINLASSKPRRIGDILEELLGMSSVKIDVVEDQARMRPSDVPYAAGASRLAEDLLAWKPAIKWEDTLRSVLDYWRERV